MLPGPETIEHSNDFRNTLLLLQQPGAIEILRAIAFNQAKRLKLLRGERGGNRVLAAGVDSTLRLACSNYAWIAPFIGDISGKAGLEIGPGDNLGLASCFLANGARSMHAVEQFASVQWSDELHARVHAVYRAIPTARPDLHVCRFEGCSIRDLDFIYSIDVIEHVSDLRQVFRAAFNALKPGGLFVNAIDFRGHNAFNLESAPLNFLICDDWLYELMHSHIVTSNRCRPGEVIRALELEGFEVKSVVPQRLAEEDYVRRVRHRLLPRFRSIPVSELMILEAWINAQKPFGPGGAAGPGDAEVHKETCFNESEQP